MDFINREKISNYYILIKINHNMDLNIVDNAAQVIGIFSSRLNAEEKINNLLSQNININFPKYIIQGPFSIDM